MLLLRISRLAKQWPLIKQNRVDCFLKNIQTSIGNRHFCNNLNEPDLGPPINLEDFPPERIRNFCIIAHIDHGKSTLSDRLMEESGLLSKDEKVHQYLDRLQVEKDRGITVKAQSVSLVHTVNEKKYLLNLIDTPGHADFSFEVWRSIPVCQAALLLVDAKSGVQAQTIAHFNQALLSDLNIVPIINKIDLKGARVDAVIDQMEKLFSFTPEEIHRVSAKTGEGVKQLMDSIVTKIAAPSGKSDQPLEAIIFDSWHKPFLGVQCLVNIRQGELKIGDRIRLSTTNIDDKSTKVYEIRSLGIFHPNEVPVKKLSAGQVGYFSALIHDLNELSLGDLMISEHAPKREMEKTRNVQCAKQMVYAGIYPCDASQTQSLRSAITKLQLTDNSVEITQETSPALGYGFRLGFLGLLHMEVFCQRLEQEFDAPTVITAPNVTYKVKIFGEKNIKFYGTDELEVNNPHKMPDSQIVKWYKEPMIKATIITPDLYLSMLNQLVMDRRGVLLDSSYIDQKTLCLIIRLPLSEVVLDFNDHLKSISSGFASFDYELDGYEELSVCRLDFFLNGKILDELSMIVPKVKLRSIARSYCLKLKENLSRQQFNVAIQAGVGSKIIAREDLKAYRKDITQKLKSGGDAIRRKKLLSQQAEGKKRMRMVGEIEVSRDLLINVLRK